MAETLLSLKGVQTPDRPLSYPATAVDFDVPEGGLTMLLGRNGAGQDHDLAHHHGDCGAPPRGEIRFGRPRHHQAGDAGPSPGSASAYVAREQWRSSPTSRCREKPPARRRALGSPRSEATSTGFFSRFEALKRFSGQLPAGHLVGRPEADAGSWPRGQSIEPRRLLLIDEPDPGGLAPGPSSPHNDRGLFRELKDRRDPACWVVEQNFGLRPPAFGRPTVAVMDDGKGSAPLPAAMPAFACRFGPAAASARPSAWGEHQ